MPWVFNLDADITQGKNPRVQALSTSTRSWLGRRRKSHDRGLVTLLDGTEIGRVHNDTRGRLTFVYDDQWRNTSEAYQLSLSMPIAAKEHGRAAVEAFLWGLLPDNEQVLARWAAKFQVSARNVFALISHVGEDCAGAVQFVTPERLEAIRSGKEVKS